MLTIWKRIIECTGTPIQKEIKNLDKRKNVSLNYKREQNKSPSD